jgi:hypothetical protein
MVIRLLHVPAAWLHTAGAPQASAGAAADPFASGDGLGRGGSKPEPRFATNATVLQLLRASGLPLPEGSSATYDAEHEILLMRSTPEMIAQVVPMFRTELESAAPKTAALTAHVVQADGALIRKLLVESRKTTDHTAQWQAVEAALANGSVTIPSSVWIETKSGQRSKFMSGDGIATMSADLETQTVPSTTPSAPKPGDKKDTPALTTINVMPQAEKSLTGIHSSTLSGTVLEIDPVIGEDGQTLDLTFALDYDYAPPTINPSPQREPNSLRIEAPSTDFHQAHLNLSTTLLSGTWRLVGIWKPQGTPDFDGKDVLQAMFIRMDVLAAEVVR